MTKFPTVTIKNVEVPKVLIGINSVLGWSHTSRGAEVFTTAVRLGVTGLLGPVWPKLHDAIKMTEDITGEKITFVATTIGAREETEKQVEILKELDAPFCCLHGGH